MLMRDVAQKKCRSSQRPPFWFMRQAGRYLPEYQHVRQEAGGFLNLCQDVEKAVEVTLQPLRRFDMDAAILFSDILVIPHALGLNLHFAEQEGPRLSGLPAWSSVSKLPFASVCEHLPFVKDILHILRQKLPSSKALIGFSGAPWTLACYMVDGKATPHQDLTRKAAYEEEKGFTALIEGLTESVITYLSMQIEAGADVVQLFDSHSSFLSPFLFEKYIISPHQKIIQTLKARYPNTAIISFPRGAGTRLIPFAQNVLPDVVGCDTGTSVETMRELQHQGFCVQGALDPYVLFGTPASIEREALGFLEKLEPSHFIFNLGHGILPKTPPENVQFLAETIQKFQFSGK